MINRFLKMSCWIKNYYCPEEDLASSRLLPVTSLQPASGAFGTSCASTLHVFAYAPSFQIFFSLTEEKAEVLLIYAIYSPILRKINRNMINSSDLSYSSIGKRGSICGTIFYQSECCFCKNVIGLPVANV